METDKSIRLFNFAQILPNNDRIKYRIELEKLEREERIKVDLENQKRKEEIRGGEIFRLLQLEREKNLKLKEIENEKEDIKSRRQDIIYKVKLKIKIRKEIYLTY
jgi:23S rRNA-/tRNA-specific pseudouridylate synthase